MAKLTRVVTVTTIRYEETEELTDEQLKLWESDEDGQEELMDELEFELVNDKVLEDTEWPELIK
jgi:hypothetical protein